MTWRKDIQGSFLSDAKRTLNVPFTLLESPRDVAMFEDRSEYRFREAAQDALGFLIKDHGFTCADASDLQVTYVSDKVHIDMNHGLHDCEVYISFGRVDRHESFSLQLFLKLVNPTLEKSLGDRMVDKPETVATTAKALARALQLEGQAIIKGDDEVFERIKPIRFWHFWPEALGKKGKKKGGKGGRKGTVTEKER